MTVDELKIVVANVGALIALVMLSVSLAHAGGGISLTVGRLEYNGDHMEQAVMVKNDTPAAIGSVEVNCGFFSNGELVATARDIIYNIAPGTSAFHTITAENELQADRAECRVVPLDQ